MWTKKVLFAGLVALIISQVDAASINVGPQIGFYKARDADNGSFIGGATCRLKFTPALGAEASINYRQEDYLNKAVTVRSWPVMATALFYPLPVIYGAIGAGWYNTTYDFNEEIIPLINDKTTQEFGWHFGIGTEMSVAPNILFTGDIRYVFLDYDFNDMPGSDDLKSDFFVITAGILFVL